MWPAWRRAGWWWSPPRRPPSPSGATGRPHTPPPPDDLNRTKSIHFNLKITYFWRFFYGKHIIYPLLLAAIIYFDFLRKFCKYNSMEFQRKLRYKGMNVYNFLVQIGHTFVILFLENIALKSTKISAIWSTRISNRPRDIRQYVYFWNFNSAPTV